MSELISRQKLIEAIKKWQTEAEPEEARVMEDVICLVESQPPADQWIPCSEREPEDPCVYTVEDCSLYTVNKFGSPQRYVWKVLPPMFGTNYRLVAWKPINPEPYKGVE